VLWLREEELVVVESDEVSLARDFINLLRFRNRFLLCHLFLIALSERPGKKRDILAH
jgi:hypothetical protein